MLEVPSEPGGAVQWTQNGDAQPLFEFSEVPGNTVLKTNQVSNSNVIQKGVKTSIYPHHVYCMKTIHKIDFKVLQSNYKSKFF